jgi:hypothetical protein
VKILGSREEKGKSVHSRRVRKEEEEERDEDR